jgi:signal transduction histidine kinase
VYNLVCFARLGKASTHPISPAIRSVQSVQISTSNRQVFISLGLAVLAALLSLAFFNAELVIAFQNAVLLQRDLSDSGLTVIPFWIAIILSLVASVVAAAEMERLGAREALPRIALGIMIWASVSLLASWFLSIDILFTPLLVATVVSIVAVQVKRLCLRDYQLTQQLAESAKRLNSSAAANAHSRLLSGLRLIETVLSPLEAVVFHYDSEGQLVSGARVRSNSSGALDLTRNSSWRDGITFCEQAIQKNSIITRKNETGFPSINVAIPLRHESRTVGALLLRLSNEFDKKDRALLKAVGSQMARNLQREEAFGSATRINRLGVFSVRSAEQKLESLYVLNGLLSEQRFGVRALSEVSEGLALAYLDGTIAYMNSTLLAYANLTEEDARSLDLLSLLNKLRTDVFDEPAFVVRQVLQTGGSWSGELSFAQNASTYELRISLMKASTPDGNDEPLCLAIHLTDLTRLKEHNQLKSDMISLMSHELRTPLTSINGFAELLTADQDLPEQAKEFVTIIANESQRLSRMINTFLAVSQLERKDKQEVSKIPLRLDEVARDIVASMQPIARKRRIRLVEQPTQRLPPVAADKSLISQAVKNLVSNAIKYSPERTTVTVTTALEASNVRVSVEDRGYGIPAEARDRVWEKFYRVVREGQEKDDESTGLGLSFVREVVEQHGGRVELETEEGRGSRFSFTLPRF